MRTFLSALICVGFISFSASLTCTPAFSPGFTNTSVCAQAYEVENGYWLPDAYIHNAVCACQQIPTSSSQGDCIRQFLITRLANETKYTQAFKQEMMELKEEYNAAPISDVVDYKSFVVNTFVPMVYEDHQDAYRECCCKGTPAFYDSWELIATVDVPTCGLVEDAIVVFGSCNATPGQW